MITERPLVGVCITRTFQASSQFPALPQLSENFWIDTNIRVSSYVHLFSDK